MYRAESNEFQADAICQKGYTYQIFMCNGPAQNKCLAKRLSPRHDMVMALFGTVEKNTINL